MALRRRLLPALLVLLVLPAPASAGPPLRATAAVVRDAGGPRLQVVLTASRALTPRTRPRAVRARIGGRAIALRRTRAAGRTSTWRSSVLSGASAAALEALAGKAVSLTVVTRRARLRLSSVLPAAAPPGPGPLRPPRRAGAARRRRRPWRRAA